MEYNSDIFKRVFNLFVSEKSDVEVKKELDDMLRLVIEKNNKPEFNAKVNPITGSYVELNSYNEACLAFLEFRGFIMANHLKKIMNNNLYYDGIELNTKLGNKVLMLTNKVFRDNMDKVTTKNIFDSIPFKLLDEVEFLYHGNINEVGVYRNSVRREVTEFNINRKWDELQKIKKLYEKYNFGIFDLLLNGEIESIFVIWFFMEREQNKI